MKRRMFEKILVKIVVLLALMTLMGQTVFAEQTEVKVFINGEMLHFDDAGPVIQEGSTLVPFRKLFETLEFQVKWIDSEGVKKAIGTKEGLDIELTINSLMAKVNGKDVALEVPAQIINGNTMVPLRFVSENSGNDVTYSKEGNALIIQISKRDESCDNNQTLDKSNKSVYLNIINAIKKLKSYSFHGTTKIVGAPESTVTMNIDGSVILQPEIVQHFKSSMEVEGMKMDIETINANGSIYTKLNSASEWRLTEFQKDNAVEGNLLKCFSCEVLDAIKNIHVVKNGNEMEVDIIFDAEKYDTLLLKNTAGNTVSLKQHFVIEAETSLPKSVVSSMEVIEEGQIVNMQTVYSYTSIDQVEPIVLPTDVIK